jgi:hypothetical protein
MPQLLQRQRRMRRRRVPLQPVLQRC